MNEPIDITGKRFGYLTVIKRADDYIQPNGRRRIMWLCQCDCGNQKVIYGDNLRGSRTLSCGCFQKKRASEAVTTHGDTDSRLYNIWCAMKRRCNTETVREYKNYGGRGIKVCSLWEHDYSSFMRWALETGYDATAPRGVCTLDRIDVNGNYDPNNCRWITQKQQMSNVRYNVNIEYNGQTHTVAEWADICGMQYSTLRQRLFRYGYTFEEAITKPVRNWRTITTN